MQFSALVPMLYTKELEQTVAFYENVLGFTCGEFNSDWGWAALHRDSCEIMFAFPNDHIPFQSSEFTGSFYFKLDDVDGFWRAIEEKATIVYPIETFEWGMREFAIKDNNGYVLQFGSEIQL